MPTRTKTLKRIPRHELDRETSLELNDVYRHGGDMKEDRDGGSRDLLGDMTLAAKRSDVLANDLIRMGVIPDGDDYPDEM